MRLLIRLRPLLESRRLLPGLLLLTALLTLPALFVGFASDDHFFRATFEGFPGLPEYTLAAHEVFVFFSEDSPAVRAARLERGLLPWWTGEQMHIAFMRPLSSLSHWLDHQLFGDAAWLAHLHSNLWYLGCVLLAALLFRRLVAPVWLAGLAAVLYAFDEAHGLSVGWLAARNGLMTTFFAFGVLLAHDHWRRSGRWWGLPLALVALALGLASGEASLGVGGFLFAYALFADEHPFPRAFVSLLPYAGVVVVWALIYRHFGFGVKYSGAYADPLGQPLLFLQFLAAHLPVLFVSQFGLPDSTAFNFFSGPLAVLYWLGAVLGVAFFLWLLWPLLREERRARFWALGMLLSAVPSTAVAPQDRLLGLSGIGVAALIALFLGRVVRQVELQAETTRWLRVARRVAPVAVAIHLMLAPLLLALSSYFLITLVEQGTLKADASVPRDGVEDLSAIMINAPSDVMNVAVLIYRSSLHRPLPRNSWLLTATNLDVHVFREDARTLVLTPEGGYLAAPWANRFRDARNEPMRPGDTVRLSRMEAEVLDALPDGRPSSVRFRFDLPLDDPRLHFVAWEGNEFIPYTPPPVGASHTIPGLNFKRLLSELLGGSGE